MIILEKLALDHCMEKLKMHSFAKFYISRTHGIKKLGFPVFYFAKKEYFKQQPLKDISKSFATL